VYTNIYALEGDGFEFAQLHDYAERLRTELLRVPNVNKVDFIADQEQRIYVEIANVQLAKLGLTPQQIADAVNAQNAVAGSGSSPPRPIASMFVRAVNSRTHRKSATR